MSRVSLDNFRAPKKAVGVQALQTYGNCVKEGVYRIPFAELSALLDQVLIGNDKATITDLAKQIQDYLKISPHRALELACVMIEEELIRDNPQTLEFSKTCRDSPTKRRIPIKENTK